jgi:hypothetical protein
MPDIVPKALTLRHLAQTKAGADAVVWRHVWGRGVAPCGREA